MRSLTLFSWILSILCACSSLFSNPRPDLVAAVRSGELKEARVSWWGFDPQDSTRFLQEAISSRVPLLVVDRMPTAWVTRPLRGVSHQEIRFEQGVELAAKPGAFLGLTDALLTLRGVSDVKLSGYGAVLRMRRSDYMRPPYPKAEWRHALSLISCKRIQIEGLAFVESGGDGIYLGSASPQFPNIDIRIRDVLCDRNYRQGISVISAENLLIEHTLLQNTGGTPPSAGIDFEPNHPGERLKNCVMRNCLSKNNDGNGFEFYLGQMRAASEPVDIRLENCRSEEDRYAFSFASRNGRDEAVAGAVRISDCTFRSSRSHAVRISRKPRHGAGLWFEGCRIEACGVKDQGAADILFESDAHDLFPPDQIRLDSLRIRQPVSRPWFSTRNLARIAEPVTAITGTVRVESPEKKREIALDDAWRRKSFPLLLAEPIGRLPLQWERMTVTDPHPGQMIKLSPLRIRSRARYLFYVEKPRKASWLAARKRIGNYADLEGTGKVLTLAGRELARFPLKGEGLETYGCGLPAAGFYALEVQLGAHGFTLLASDVPVAVDLSGAEQNFISSPGRAWLSVPLQTGRFAFYFSGSSGNENLGARILDPDGRTRWEDPCIGEWKCYEPPQKIGMGGGLWTIELFRPNRGAWEDFSVDVVGVPGCLFLSSEKYWTAEELPEKENRRIR